QLATDLQEVFRDGAAFVVLAALHDPALVAEAIAQTLGVRGTASRSLEQVLAEHLSSRHLLLVLDNFEQILAARAYVAEMLAATRARTMSPKAILDQLGQRLDLLSAGPADFSPRQRSIRGALDWSYDLLDNDARAVFGRMSVFADSATLDAVAGVCTDDARS